MVEFRIFDSRAAASATLADHISETLARAVAERGRASFVVSGGSSPLATYQALRRHILPWQNVTIVPSDERLVPVDHEDSNEGMIRRELMQQEAATAQLLSLAGDLNPSDVQLLKLNSHLDSLDRPLDIVMLGMGDDGHTASLFPDSPNINKALSTSDYCVVQQQPYSKVARLSLTPALLLAAREIVLLFFGLDKRAVYRLAIGDGEKGTLPVRFLLHQQNTPVSVYWAS